MPLVCHECGHSSSWDTVPPQSPVVPAPDIPGHRAALVEIQAEIARFKTFSAFYISALEEQQNGIEANLRVIVFPVLSLPAEITSRIFIECLPDNDVSPSTAHAPLLLTRVCRQWKDIAIATCQLWSSLCIEFVSSHGKIMVPRGTSIELQAWLSRGRQHPLSVTSKYKHGAQIQDFVQLDISSFVHRVWRFHGPLPNMKDIMKNAPLLAALYWCSGEALCGFTSHAITTLHVDERFSSLEFISILQQFPSLSDFACWVLLDANHRPAPLTFPNLSSLGLHWEETRDMLPPIHALELLTLPNLTSLACSFSLEPAVVLPFLSRSACVIRELKCELYGDDISRYLENFPSVETLDITVISIANVLQALDPMCNKVNPSPLILPKLQRVKINCEDEMSLAHYRHILDIVHGRRAHPDMQELQSLHISVESFECRCIVEDFPPYSPTVAGLRSCGLDLKVDVDRRVVWPKTLHDFDSDP